jgi:uncharacterized protein (TIGR03790 family)
MMFPRSLSLFLLSVLLLCRNNSAEAQSAANVLLVINDASEASRTIGDYYARKRAILPANTCHVTTGTDDGISRVNFDQQIQLPISRCIAGTFGQDRIIYIVLTKGVPLRVDGTGGRDGNVASVDSELALLYRRQTGVAVPTAGFVPNPYFAGNQPIAATFKPFTHEQADIYLVVRLDGYTVQDVIGLIDRAGAGVKEGKVLLDGRSSWQANGNVWLRTAADTLKAMGQTARLEFDESSQVLKDETQVLGYYSWGSNDPAIRTRTPNLSFVPGAIAAMFVSTDARTFTEPPAAWTIGDWEKRETWFGGSPQSLTGDLIRAGVTATAGHVAEPFLDATIRPDILFPAYLNGANVAEAFYLAMPYLSWQTVVIGDPLGAPFRQASLSADAIDRGLDAATELPAMFGARRLKVMEANQVKHDAAAAFLRHEARSARGNVPGAREALEQAALADGHFTAAHVLLGTSYQADGTLDRAEEHYRAVLAYQPNNAVVLNNLAYLVGVSRNLPLDGLPFAERAHAIVPKDAILLDTLGWIQHLLNRDADAMRSFAAAVAGAPAVAEIRWHAAVVFAAASEFARASTELDAALKLDPRVAEHADVRKLRDRLAAKSPTR